MKKFLLITIGLMFLFMCKQEPAVDPTPDPTPDPTYDTTIFYDDIENGVKDWVADPTINSSRWYIVGGYSHTLTHSWSGYNRELNNVMNLTSKSFDLTGYKDDVLLTFWTAYNIEENYDFGYVEYSIDSGSTWTRLLTITGLQDYWIKKEITISGVGDIVDFQLRFSYQTDGSNQSVYWYIDDVKLSGNVK